MASAKGRKKKGCNKAGGGEGLPPLRKEGGSPRRKETYNSISFSRGTRGTGGGGSQRRGQAQRKAPFSPLRGGRGRVRKGEKEGANQALPGKGGDPRRAGRTRKKLPVLLVLRAGHTKGGEGLGADRRKGAAPSFWLERGRTALFWKSPSTAFW